ncbi:Bifunctional inhibitor/lipid-transfer protein/seed storage 2S albumin superfamily protein [Thalictrum thalictroides]|uniref:Bifunctional inhibitor/lipid-transfer protein/seed storage 2S albumin superfamily protein n=1 Tax=Thalictrum thalictroides TaxID=46969 RepID=A0A7J6VD26_THATH|nr:Bifunctional inhibitor/lipid-transfer protein/seed storage 2S albumin superfamily protein [Thalictrum thalictroides]
MAFSNKSCLVLATILMVGILIFSQQVSSQGECGGALQGLLNNCAAFVTKFGPQTDPSKACCDVVKAADVPCVCQHIPPGAELIVSMEKVVYVANFCGKELPHGTKCGSYTIPPASSFEIEE